MSAEPMMPAEREPNRTAILPAERSVSVALGSSAPNERVSTKMAIVNPMPPRHATANSIFHDAPSGMAPILNLIAKNDANVIPSGLPNNKPKKIPIPTNPVPSIGRFWKMLKKLMSGMTTPALANANIGMMRKFTHRLRACSKRYDKPMELLLM